MEEWQRLPKEMLQNYCQKEKWQKPSYHVIKGSGGGRQFLCRAVLDDGKRRRVVYPSSLSAGDKAADSTACTFSWLLRQAVIT